MRNHRIALSMLAATLSMAVSGCWVSTFSDPANFDETVTVYDPDYDFADNETFAMPEEIFDLSALTDAGAPIDYTHEQLLLDEVANQMALLGYDRVADPEGDDPDVVLAVGAVVEEDWAYGYYFWGDYYYYYPPIGVSVKYEVGTIIIVMLNVKELDEVHKTVPVVWVAGLRGLMYGRTKSEAREAVAQAFRQSPYLYVGPEVPSKPGLQPPDGGDDEPDAGDDAE